MAPNPRNDINELIADAGKTVRDGAYAVVGLGVLGFNQAQVRRREMAARVGSDRDSWTSQLNTVGGRLGDLRRRAVSETPAARARLSELARSADERLAPVRHHLDERADSFETTLPPGARQAMGTLRSTLAASEARIRHAIGLD